MSTRAPFLYSPLKAGQIRLLKLLPGTQGDEVAIEIIQRAAESQPKYEALSYVWGLPDRTHQIAIEQTYASSLHTTHPGNRISAEFGHSGATPTLAIGKNLFVALEHLRHKKDARVLWIDAICINQHDPTEKSTEVLRMGNIYRNAQRVIVWLGEESEDSTLAMSKLREIGQDIYYQIHGPLFIVDLKPGSNLRHLEAHEEQVARASCIAINRLFNRSWFTRLWVLQEIGLASHAIVVAGGEYIEWDVFRGAMLWIGTQANSLFSGLFDDDVLDRLDAFVYPAINYGLTIYCAATTHTHCLDPRDRIYAVLNLLQPDVADRIVPDYGQSVEQIYTDATLAEIEGRQTLDILSFCAFPDQKLASESRRHRLQPLVLPSWVPDFSCPTSFSMKDSLSIATGSSSPESRYEETTVGSLFKIGGRLIDSISFVSAPMPTDACLQDALEMCQKWEPADANAVEYVTGGLLIEAFASVISPTYTRTKEFSTFPPAKDLVVHYYDWVRNYDLTNQDISLFARKVHLFLKGKVLFTTQKGYLGVCSAGARAGDHVCIAIGCDNPLIIRPTSSTKGHYQIGGGCFVPGLQFGEGLLGPLPLGWRCNNVWRDCWHVLEFCDPLVQRTQLDPRGGPLPSGWEVHNDTKDEVMHFVNVKTGEQTYCDPRLSTENLKTLGIELEEIVLV